MSIDRSEVTQSCLTSSVPMDYAFHGILQYRILEWVAFPFSKGSSQPGDWTQVSHLAADSLPAEPHSSLNSWSYMINWSYMMSIWLLSVQFTSVAQSCPTLCDPMDYAFHGILQARILEWVAFSFCRESSQPRDWTQVSHIAGRFFTHWATREAQGGLNMLNP